MMTKQCKGFTLVELITVMVITGIISMTVVNLITTPMEGYADMKRRAELVDIAELTLHRMARDIHHALPNSVCINRSGTSCDNNTSGQSIEILHTIEGGRYKKSSFELSKQISSLELEKEINTINSSDDPSTCGFDDKVDCIVIYNLGQSGANAYASENISPVTGQSADRKTINFALKKFPYDSPQKRLMIIDKAIYFSCEGDKLYMYQGYDFRGVPSNKELLADNIALNPDATPRCQFDYNPGTATRPGLVTLQISINDADHANETVTLLHQIFVENQP